MFRYAYRHLGDAQQAEDCVAETFRRFLQALHAGRGPEKHLQAYLYRIAHNWITDQFRRQQARDIPLDDLELANPEAGPEEDAIQRL